MVAKPVSSKRTRDAPVSKPTASNNRSCSEEMPLVQRGPSSPSTLRSRCEGDDESDRSSMSSSSPGATKKQRPPVECKAQAATNHEDEDMEAPPMSPRVRKRLDDAKENASLFGAVCSQGEVIQWMSACHPELIEFGRELERRGFHTLSSIAFLTEEDIDCGVDAAIKQLLLATLSRLRHEFFRM